MYTEGFSIAGGDNPIRIGQEAKMAALEIFRLKSRVLNLSQSDHPAKFGVKDRRLSATLSND